MVASTLAISVLPTPASPSSKSGFAHLQGEVQRRGKSSIGDVALVGEAGRQEIDRFERNDQCADAVQPR